MWKFRFLYHQFSDICWFFIIQYTRIEAQIPVDAVCTDYKDTDAKAGLDDPCYLAPFDGKPQPFIVAITFRDEILQ